jgi:prevent-host-death family protein
MNYGIAEVKARFSEIAGYVALGQEVVITRHGKPCYRLVPYVEAANHASPQQTQPKLTEVKQGPKSIEELMAFFRHMQAQSIPYTDTPNFVATLRERNEL